MVRNSEFRATVKRKLQRWGSKRNATVVPANKQQQGDSYDIARRLACVRQERRRDLH